jgi:4-aminobutyrate aminotransferase-like enzyme
VTPRAAARTIVEALRDEGVLIGATGQDGGTLKIRPPLIWTPRQVDELVTALRRILGTIETEEQQ